MIEPRVWIRKRACKGGKTTHHLRWVCPTSATWKSRKVGTDSRQATREAAALEAKLREGTYRDVRRLTWAAFVEDHVSKIPGKRNAAEAKRTLEEFGTVCSPAGPHAVTFAKVESYVAHLRQIGNALATQNKKLRYLKHAFRMAMRRGFAGANPMEGWAWEREDKKTIRVVSVKEEAAILKAASDLYGDRWKAFIQVALGTGGRRGELLRLRWGHVDFDAATVTFTETKGKADRAVPVNPDLVAVLRRLQARTLQCGGPFIGMADNLSREWGRIRKAASVADVSIHDMRRTYATRLLRAGAALDVVQELLGHSSLVTTMKYYISTKASDKREAVGKLRSAAG